MLWVVCQSSVVHSGCWVHFDATSVKSSAPATCDYRLTRTIEVDDDRLDWLTQYHALHGLELMLYVYTYTEGVPPCCGGTLILVRKRPQFPVEVLSRYLIGIN
jgi:hypothetical protein